MARNYFKMGPSENLSVATATLEKREKPPRVPLCLNIPYQVYNAQDNALPRAIIEADFPATGTVQAPSDASIEGP